MNWRFWEDPPKKLEQEPPATFLFARGENELTILSVERCRHPHNKNFITEVTFLENGDRYTQRTINYEISYEQHEIFTTELAKDHDFIVAKKQV